MGAQDPRNGSPIFDHQFLGIIHEDVDLLISDNDSISLLRQLDHEPAREKEITNYVATTLSLPRPSGK